MSYENVIVRDATLEERGMVESIVDELRKLIQLREYRVGERIPSERELAVHFDVSRPKVRRAIATLVEHGALEARDRSGVYVRGTDAAELRASRLVIEPWAAAQAARLASPEDLVQLSELLQRATASIDDEVEFSGCDRGIHDWVLVVARNTVMAELYASLQQRIDASRGRTGTRIEIRRQSLADLRELAAALHAVDPEAAATAMRRHLETLPA